MFTHNDNCRWQETESLRFAPQLRRQSRLLGSQRAPQVGHKGSRAARSIAWIVNRLSAVARSDDPAMHSRGIRFPPAAILSSRIPSTAP
eukprot:6213138-Pleurochrysis_carterae.AAC.4